MPRRLKKAPYCENDHKKERMWLMSIYCSEKDEHIVETYYWCPICGKKKIANNNGGGDEKNKTGC